MYLKSAILLFLMFFYCCCYCSCCCYFQRDSRPFSPILVSANVPYSSLSESTYIEGIYHGKHVLRSTSTTASRRTVTTKQIQKEKQRYDVSVIACFCRFVISINCHFVIFYPLPIPPQTSTLSPLSLLPQMNQTQALLFIEIILSFLSVCLNVHYCTLCTPLLLNQGLVIFNPAVGGGRQVRGVNNF